MSVTVDFTVRAGTLLEKITGTLLKPDGTAYSLAGKTVKFVMRHPEEFADSVNASATVLVEASGTVEYAWTAGQTILFTPGYHYGQWEIYSAGVLQATVPSGSYLVIEVTPAL